jgi:hypothetical protein
MQRRRWLRWLRRRNWYRYLRITATRAYTAIGPKRTILGLFAVLAGGVLNVDLGFAVAVLVAILFALQWLVLTPAEMWNEAARAQSKDQPVSPHIVVQSGATYIEQFYEAGEVSSSDGTAVPSRSAPRSPRRSKRDPQLRLPWQE